MKIQITIDYEIDGDADDNKVIHAFSRMIPGCILSENVDGTEDYAVMIEEYETEILKENNDNKN